MKHLVTVNQSWADCRRSEWSFDCSREKESEVTTHPAPGTFWDPPEEPSPVSNGQSIPPGEDPALASCEA